MSFYRVVDDIRSSLHNRGYDRDYVDSICEEAAEALAGLVADVVAAALNDAEAAGLDAGIEDFVEELTAKQSGDTFVITTKSGRTNFSTPERKMLNSLLKNGKTAKDGSRYARIPINDKKVPTSSFDVETQRQAHLTETKEQLDAGIRKGGLGQDIGKAARDFASSFAHIRKQAEPAKTRGRSSTIRTVSSKQDPNSQWVIPAKDKDAGSILQRINSQLEEELQNAMRAIYERYAR